MSRWVHKQVLRFNVSMNNTESMYIGQSAVTLVGIELHQESGYCLLHLVVVLKDSVYGFRNVVHDNIQVNLIGLHVRYGYRRANLLYRPMYKTHASG